MERCLNCHEVFAPDDDAPDATTCSRKCFREFVRRGAGRKPKRFQCPACGTQYDGTHQCANYPSRRYPLPVKPTVSGTIRCADCGVWHDVLADGRGTVVGCKFGR